MFQNFRLHIQVGEMNYSIELESIIGLDLLKQCSTALDLKSLILTTAYVIERVTTAVFKLIFT